MHTTRGRELELSTKKLKIQKTSQRYLTLFQMPVVIWERWIAYGMCTGDTDFCIDHLQHTEAEVIVEDMGAFEEDGDLLITALDDADATFQERLHWSAPA